MDPGPGRRKEILFYLRIHSVCLPLLSLQRGIFSKLSGIPFVPTILPKIQFFSSSLLGKVPIDAQWIETPLPDNRSGSFQTDEGLWTYGRYFQAIKEVITGESCALLLEAAQKQLAALYRFRTCKTFVFMPKNTAIFITRLKLRWIPPGDAPDSS